MNNSLRAFFQTLEWEVLEDRVRLALSDANEVVPKSINCPAVDSLANLVFTKIAADAFERPGSPIAGSKLGWNLDNHVAVLRLLESLITLAEDYETNGPKSSIMRHQCKLPGPNSKNIPDVHNGGRGLTDQTK